MLGREILGVPKLFAEISDARLRDGQRGFTVAEYGNLLLDGQISDLRQLSEQNIQALMEQNRNSILMAWKYIPSTNFRGADLSFATALPSNTIIKKAWTGVGGITFHEVSREKAPLSYHIVHELKKLPIIQYRDALMMQGSTDLLISEQRPMH